MNFSCPAIDHGVAIFPDGKIRPCCQTSADYSKPMSEIDNPNRFADLKSQDRPQACRMCWEREDRGHGSARKWYLSNATNGSGIQFLDFRHTNQCNLKCRYCNPHFSNQWAKELNYPTTLLSTPVEHYYHKLLTDDLVDLYWCGGEPLIIKEHYEVLEQLIQHNRSQNISLRYNTNFTTVNYKDKNILDLWKNFKSVDLNISLDTVGTALNYIRSGSDWEKISHNIDQLLATRSQLPTLRIKFTPTVSLLNLWFLEDLYNYATEKNIPVALSVLYGPDYLSMSSLYCKELVDMAQHKLMPIKKLIGDGKWNEIFQNTGQADNEYLFHHAMRHILLLDSIRQENLFALLPFREFSIKTTLVNREYE